MSESSSSAQASDTKKCSDCHLTCNSCSRRYGKRNQDINLQNATETDLNVIVPTISTFISGTNNAADFLQVNNIIENYDLEPTPEENFLFNDDFTNVIEIEELDNDDANTLTYCMDKVEIFVFEQFQDTELFSETTKFAFEIELDTKLLYTVALNQDPENDPLNLKRIKESFAQITKILILLLESGSKYYWENFQKKQNSRSRDTLNNLRSSELYRYLIENRITNFYHLERPEIVVRGFKILSYFENNFVRALGFATPLLYRIVSDNLKTVDHYPEDGVTTRVQVLQKFFVSLHQEGLLPTFVLSDKDAGEILAVSEAWWYSNIQLCYWHLENAISRRLKDKKPQSNTYTQAKALEAHRQFSFIDPSWIPASDIRTLYSEEISKEFKFITIEYKRSIFTATITGVVNCGDIFDWSMFARSAYSHAIPLARTTMITESHWRVFKYKYKYNYNRPRLDHLNNILVEQLAFKKDWDRAISADIMPDMDERYQVDVNNWKTTNIAISETNLVFENLAAEGSCSNCSQNISIMKERQEKYTYYTKKFEKALELYKREMDNDNFVKNFDTLVRPFVKSVEECEEALRAHKQQEKCSKPGEEITKQLFQTRRRELSKPGEEITRKIFKENYLRKLKNVEESSLTFWSLSLMELLENYQRAAPKQRRDLQESLIYSKSV
ncbi:27991_t:CDS:10 [Gigaspora margarita]|uniref:27991_t:CDS:1 n=1 Tax=Gigaspora margarita TaxID=4874 RepID=A0ABM8VYG3_GIGMA|nr:27991_t:CDS:10 [Gigaspora margarita]